MWSRVPLVRLIIPYIIGILLSDEFGGNATLPFKVLVVAGGILIIGALLYGVLFSFRSRWVFGSLVIIFFLSSAYFQQQKGRVKEKAVLLDVPSDTSLYIGTIAEGFEQRERSCRGLLRIIGLKDSSGLHPFKANVMVYTEPDSLLPLLKPGNVILFKASVKAVSSPSNPAEFDYNKYLSRREIYLSTYLKRGQWLIGDSNEDFNLHNYAIAVRKQLLKKLQAHGIHDQQYAVSSALLLGDDSHLADDIREMYARAGAMHILCVSGLHVGVIFMVLSLMLGFLKQLRLGRFMLPFLLIGSIWSYALITGLAPPVTRASFMISLIIIGNTLQRYRNVYNTLAAAAMLMLMISPSNLFGAGFQLSYAAVLGIVFLQKPLNKLFYFKYSLPDKMWSITAVSIAAQLGTLPVILFYFHQFPVYSLLTNLIVIPLSSLIIYSGILLFALPSMSQLAMLAAWLLKKLIQVMEMGVSFVEKLPCAIITDISIDVPTLMMLYLITILFCLYFLHKTGGNLLAGLFFVLLLSSYHLYSNHRIEWQRKFVVYSVSGYSAYDLIDGRDHIFHVDSVLLNDAGKMNYSIKPHWLECGLREPMTEQLPSLSSSNIDTGTWKIENGILTPLHVPDMRVVVWQGSLPACMPPEERLLLDHLILRGSCQFSPASLLKWFEPEIIILDSSVPWWKAEKLKAEIDSVIIWDIRHQGAWESSE